MPKYLEISFFVQQPCKYSTVTSLPLLSTIHKKLSNVLSDSSTFTQWGTALTIIVSLPRVTSDFVCTPASFLSDLILGAYGSGLGCVQSCGVSSWPFWRRHCREDAESSIVSPLRLVSQGVGSFAISTSVSLTSLLLASTLLHIVRLTVSPMASLLVTVNGLRIARLSPERVLV